MILAGGLRRAAASGFAVAVGLSGVASSRPPASGAPRATATSLTVAQSGLGIYNYVSEWTATVRVLSRRAPRIVVGVVVFHVSDAGRLLASYTAPAYRARCSFKVTIAIDGSSSTYTPVKPDKCGGGTSFELDYAQAGSASLGVRAFYRGTSTWAGSCSGPVDPERVDPGQPVSRGTVATCPRSR
jgi:hypothetical protein